MRSAPVLLVEDNPDDVLLARRAFERCRVPNDLLVATSGEEALVQLLDALEGGASAAHRPGLVLLDLQLPGLDGLEVLRRVRADARTRTIPVVVLTSSRDPKDVTTSYEIGANSFLQKPVGFDEFVEIVEIVEVLTRYWLRMNVPPTFEG